MGPSPYTIGGGATQNSSSNLANLNPNLSNLTRARSTTPTNQDPNPSAFTRAHQGKVTFYPSYKTYVSNKLVTGQPKDQRMLYAELQFPVTSNYGSMKKRSQRSSANTNSTTVLSSAGEPSPPSSDDSQNISQSLDNMHRYLPDYTTNPNPTSINRKTAV